MHNGKARLRLCNHVCRIHPLCCPALVRRCSSGLQMLMTCYEGQKGHRPHLSVTATCNGGMNHGATSTLHGSNSNRPAIMLNAAPHDEIAQPAPASILGIGPWRACWGGPQSPGTLPGTPGGWVPRERGTCVMAAGGAAAWKPLAACRWPGGRTTAQSSCPAAPGGPEGREPGVWSLHTMHAACMRVCLSCSSHMPSAVFLTHFQMCSVRLGRAQGKQDSVVGMLLTCMHACKIYVAASLAHDMFVHAVSGLRSSLDARICNAKWHCNVCTHSCTHVMSRKTQWT